MAADERLLRKLQSDFESGRNPRAYIPLAQALRRAGRLSEAVDACLRGLAQDADSVGGRVIYAKILCNLGKYEDSLREIERVEALATDSSGLIITKARCYVKLRNFEEAERVLAQLASINPMDTGLRALEQDVRGQRPPERFRSSEAVPTRGAFALRIDEFAATLRSQIAPLAKLQTLAVVDLDSGRSVVEGRQDLVAAAESFFQESTIALDEMNQGSQRYALLEFRQAVVLMFRRERHLIALVTDPQANLGKVQHRISLVLQQYLPAMSTNTPRPLARPEVDTQEEEDDTTSGNPV